MKKNKVRSWIALAVVFAVYQVIAFAIPFHKTGAFWISYVFTDVAILAQAYIFYTAFKGDNPAKSKLYGFPTARLGIVYTVVQLVLSVIFMAFASVMPAWVPAVTCALVFAAAVIGTISTEAVRDEIQRQDGTLKKNVQTVRKLQSLTASLPGQSNDPAVVKILQKLAEQLRYSDPVSTAALKDIEQELAVAVDELQQSVIDGSTESTLSLCKRCSNLLTERNRMCKLSK